MYRTINHESLTLLDTGYLAGYHHTGYPTGFVATSTFLTYRKQFFLNTFLHFVLTHILFCLINYLKQLNIAFSSYAPAVSFAKDF